MAQVDACSSRASGGTPPSVRGRDRRTAVHPQETRRHLGRKAAGAAATGWTDGRGTGRQGIIQEAHLDDRRVKRPVVIVYIQRADAHDVVDRVAGNLAEDGVLLVERLGGREGDEELAAVGVRRVLVRARDQPPVTEPQPRVELVLERAAVDRLAACVKRDAREG